jgi:hypothetical protein
MIEPKFFRTFGLWAKGSSDPKVSPLKDLKATASGLFRKSLSEV